MAEAILSDIAVGLISKVGSLLVNEIMLWWGVKDELDKLKRTFSTIESVLLHAEEQSMENPQVKIWLGMLSEAMYDADDLLDEFSTEALRHRVMGGSKLSIRVRLFFSRSNQFAFGLRMAHRVKDLRERLDEIAAQKNKFHLEERSYVERRFVSNPTHSSLPEVVIGREQEREAIVELLLSPHYEENVSVVSIVGIGGLGKTTLAQLVYNDDGVQNHFELKMWVCVSDNFNVQLLVKKIVESVTKETPKTVEMDPLKDLLHAKINGKKYLLVLDDVWNEDVNNWSRFKDLLTGGATGSKIVITTRSRTVAQMSRPISIHELRGLSEKEAWSLFEQVAFKQGQLPNPSLEAMGKEIIEKCCGVPLAIKTIGGVLYLKDPNSEWLSIKDNELSKIGVFKNDILPILMLSYNHLPSHYKHCFAYCSLYPKDSKIPVEELIHLWRAQGYLKSTNSNECLSYDSGFTCFMDLFRMSFFQEIEKDDFGNIKFCKMHDLMHDLARSVAGDNTFASHFGMSINEKTQHVSFIDSHNSVTQNFSSMMRAKKIRTVFSLNVYGVHDDEVIDSMFRNLRCLRVLIFTHMEINAPPNSIYKLKHLRHLDLSLSGFKELPESITHLYNLEVLSLEGCINLMRLPNNIANLVNLTYLDNRGCHKLSHMPRGIGKLTRLEKLSEFVIAKDHSISKHGGGLDVLHSLNNLRGELEIKNLRYVKNVASECMEARLNLKQKLHKLVFYGCQDDCSENEVANEEMAMEALCPHPNLKQLKVLHYRGVKPPTWLPSITSFVSVVFENCRSIHWLPPLDQLPCLKALSVRDLEKLERINVENGGESSLFFPSLTDLALVDCPNLKGFERVSSLSTEELPWIPRLSQLEISGCSNLTCLALFPGLKRLSLDGDGLKSVMEIMKRPTNSKSTSSSFSTLSHLQQLDISNTEDSLENELLQYLPSLQSLSFWNSSFTSVHSDEKDDGMEWQSLKALRSVEFLFSGSLPKGLRYVTSLQRLYIYGCSNLACIPQWMPQLVGLRNLSISYCPQLEERCKNNTAEDWPKISHIPDISIQNKLIQRNRGYLL